MFRLLGIFFRRTLFLPVDKKEMRCVILFLAVGLVSMVYGILRSNGYLGFSKIDNTELYFNNAFGFWSMAVWITLIMKAVRTHREMNNEGLFSPSNTAQ